MPVAQGSQTSARQATLVALGGLAALLTFVFLVTRLGSLGNGGTEIPIQLGEPVFVPGQAVELASVIDDEGPILLPDASGGSRDIVVNHLGDGPEEGWVAFAARDLTAPRDCFVEWWPDDEVFLDSCSGTRYPPDGVGLQRYGTLIDEDGNLVIDLNATFDELEGDS
jgi:hypothetical protein